MKNLTYLILCLVLTFTYNSFSQKISLKYENEVNHELYDNYKDLLFKIDDSIKVLKKNGFILAEVSELKKIDSLHYRVKINKNSKFEFIKLEKYQQYFLDEVNKKLEKYFVGDRKIKLSLLDVLINDLSNLFSTQGYPFAEISVSYSNIIDSNTISGNLEIDKNQLRKIDGYIFKGYDKFPKKFVENFLGIKIGENLDVKNLENSSNFVNSLKFVRQTKVPEILFTKDSTIIYFYFEKLKKNNFDGLLTLSNSESDNKLYLNGYLKFNLLNSLDFGESIKVDYKSVDEGYKLLKTHLKIPYIFNSNFTIQSELNLTQRDSLYNSSNFLFKTGLAKKKINNYLGVEFTKSNSEFSNNNFENFKSYQIFYEVSYHLYNQNENFSNSIFSISAKLSLGEKKQLNETFQKNDFNIEIFKKTNISERSSLFSNLKFEKLNSDNLVNNELLRFGGAESIRGFIDESIATDKYFLLRNNLKFFLNKNFSLLSIFDYANYSNNVITESNNIYSLGFGFEFLSKSNHISLNYSKGVDFNQKFNFQNARLSINFVSFF
tara:strand:+ start:1087 stop:2730 length:1644 start_codon:yes stop_codon:yes gene_type:complete